jgi:hypothetical protein
VTVDAGTTILARKVLVDQTASWAGPTVAAIATVVFLAFAGWIVLQRVRRGRHRDHE